MAHLRNRFPTVLAGQDVWEVDDVLRDITFDPSTGRKCRDLHLGWEDENILAARLSPDRRSWVVVRPSGTEPSFRVYTNVHVPVTGGCTLGDVAVQAERLAAAVEGELLALMGLG
jgi:phosphomannomutase